MEEGMWPEGAFVLILDNAVNLQDLRLAGPAISDMLDQRSG
jgi:hypothetical protein